MSPSYLSGSPHPVTQNGRPARLVWTWLAVTLIVASVLTASTALALLNYSTEVYGAQLSLIRARHDLERVRRLVATIETAFRGYVLVREREYLRPMVEAEATLDAALSDLRRWAGSIPEIRNETEAIEDGVRNLVGSKRTLLLELYSYKEGDVLAHIRDGKGKILTTALQLHFERLDAALRARQAALEKPTLVDALRATLHMTGRSSAESHLEARP